MPCRCSREESFAVAARLTEMLRNRRVSIETIRDDFDEIAAIVPRPLGEHEHWVLSEARGAKRILDVGCGTGGLCRALSLQARQVVGIDLSPRMIDAAGKHAQTRANLRYITAELMSWRADSTFDCIVSIAALHHLPLPAALRKISALLRPGGRLLVVDLIAAWAPTEIPRSALTVATRVWQERGVAPTIDSRARDLWRRHGHHDRLMSLREVRRSYAEALPGAQLQRQSSWRYRASWTKPRS